MPDDAARPELSSRWKTIRIFISSTFRDMHAERDELNRAVFLALEERLRPRRCRLEPIDLRVGVNLKDGESEQEREERILKVCLDEIELSRPFILVLLGDRYGWVPDEERMNTAIQEAKFEIPIKGRSVTSLEIEYGMLQKNTERRSILFLRDPLPYEKMGDKAAIFSEKLSGGKDAAVRAASLEQFRNELESNPLLEPHLHHYSLGWDEQEGCLTGLEAWGKMAVEKIWEQLNEETLAFSQKSDLTWQQQEKFALEEFTERLSREFVGREDLVEAAVEFALSPATNPEGQAWCITAETGAGKSAFFSRVYELLCEKKEPILLAEAGGISARSGRLYWTLHRWIREMAAAMGQPVDLSDDLRGQELEDRFHEWLANTAAVRPVLILADALNQFERTDRMLSFSWLPDPLPPNVRFLATTIPGPESETLSHRKGVRVSKLPPFTPSEIEAVSKSVYRRYRRESYPEVIDQLRAISKDGKPAAGNALWLTMALELLNLLDADDFTEADRSFPGRGGERMRRYVLSRASNFKPTMEQLYGEFLTQVEKAAGKVEARTFASLIALSRHGWREEDMRALLAPAATALFPDLQAPVWDGLRFATFRRFFRGHMAARGEYQQVDFSHASLRSGIEAKLRGDWKPAGSEAIPALHSVIANYLESIPAGSSVRYDEMMGQILGTRDLLRFSNYYASPDAGSGRLADYLIDDSHTSGNPVLHFVCAAISDQRVGLEQRMEIGLKFSFDLYQALQERDGLELRAPLLEAALTLFQRLNFSNPESVEIARNLALTTDRMGDLHKGMGRGEQAFLYFKEALDLRELLRRNNPDAIDLARDLAVSYERMGDAHMELGQRTQAFEYYQRQLDLVTELYGRDPESADLARDLVVSYSRMGDLYLGQGNGESALNFYNKQIELAGDLHRYDPESDQFAADFATSYNKRGDFWLGQGNCKRAQADYEQALGIAQNLCRNHPQLAEFARELEVSNNRLGDVYLRMQHGDQALNCFEAAYEVAIELHHRYPQSAEFARDLAVSNNNLGDVHRGLGHGDQALSYFDEARRIREHLLELYPKSASLARDLANSFIRLGDLHADRGDHAAALVFYEKQLDRARDLVARDPDSIDFLSNLGVSLERMGDFMLGLEEMDAALKLYEERQSIARDLHQRYPQSADLAHDLAVSNIKMGGIYRELDEPVKALSCYEEQLEFASELHRRDSESLEFHRDCALGNERMGDLHLVMGQPEMAHGFYEEQLKIAEALHQGYSESADLFRDLEVSYNKMGELLLTIGLPAGGFFRKALDIAEELHGRYPQSSVYEHDLLACYCNMAANAEITSNDDPRQWWRMAYDLLYNMRRRGVLHPADERQIEIVKNKLL